MATRRTTRTVPIKVRRPTGGTRRIGTLRITTTTTSTTRRPR